MPALRDHREDIPELAEAILVALARGVRRDCPRLTRAALDRLMAYDWPGNVRQLEQALKYYVAFAELPDVIRRPGRHHDEWQSELAPALRRHDGSVSDAARELRVSRQAVYRALKHNSVSG